MREQDINAFSAGICLGGRLGCFSSQTHELCRQTLSRPGARQKHRTDPDYGYLTNVVVGITREVEKKR